MNGSGLVLLIGVEAIGEASLDKLADLHSSLFSEIKESRKTFFDHVKRADSQILYASPAGYVIFKTSDTELELGWLGVETDQRLQGVGSFLVAEVEAHAFRTQKSKIICYSRERYMPAVKLYLKCGYEIIGRFTGMDGDAMIKFQKKPSR